MTARRKRDKHLHVMVTDDELEQIQKRMSEAGITNAGAYMRKMALNGYILHVDLAPVRWPSTPIPTVCTRRKSKG